MQVVFVSLLRVFEIVEVDIESRFPLGDATEHPRDCARSRGLKLWSHRSKERTLLFPRNYTASAPLIIKPSSYLQALTM